MTEQRRQQIREALMALPTDKHRYVMVLRTLGREVPNMKPSEANDLFLEAIPLLTKQGITQLEFGDFVRNLTTEELTQLGIPAQ